MIVFKYIKNLKLTTGIVIIVLIGFIAASAIGGIGYKYIQKMNSNISSMYNNDLGAIEKENQMSDSFKSIRLEITKQLKNYNEKSSSKIQLMSENLNNNLNEYSNRDLNQLQKNNVEKIITSIDSYMSLWKETKSLLQNKQSLLEMKEQQLYAQGDITGDSFSKLIYEDNLNAEKNMLKVKKYIKKVYQHLYILFH